MKKRNFNPNNYYKLNNLRKKVINDIKKKIDLNNKKVLEIGCGNGTFTSLFAKQQKNTYINAIDIVKSYTDYAKEVNCQENIYYEVNTISNIKSTFDGIFMVFSLTELLKKNKLEEILNDLNNKNLKDGYVIIVDEFKDDYTEEYDQLGLKILETLGYKYLCFRDVEEKILKSNYELIYTKLYENKQNITNIHGAKLQIYYENKLNEYDKTKNKNSEDIWNMYKDEIEQLGGIRTYNKSRLIILKKKNNIIEQLKKIQSNLCLYYSLNRIEDNIRYYQDLPIENLNYVFPVKAFPNEKIMDLFNKYNFYYDASNPKEDQIVKKYKIKVFYSDPTRKLVNNSSIRLNIAGVSSHFGKEYDEKSYEIYHIHLSHPKTNQLKNTIINELKKLNYKKTKYLNIGGGYDKLSYLELKNYLEQIRKVVPKKVTILLEAGSLWFKDTGYLITKIEHIENIRGLKFVYLNACRTLHSKWSIPNYMNINKGKEEYIICGASCDEKDLFAHAYNSTLKVNDTVYFNKIEPYSYSFNTTFNGIDKAEVIIDE